MSINWDNVFSHGMLNVVTCAENIFYIIYQSEVFIYGGLNFVARLTKV